MRPGLHTHKLPHSRRGPLVLFAVGVALLLLALRSMHVPHVNLHVSHDDAAAPEQHEPVEQEAQQAPLDTEGPPAPTEPPPTRAAARGPRVAISLTGELRTFVYRGVYKSFQTNIVDKLRELGASVVDTFLVINYDLAEFGRSFAAQEADLALAIEAIQPRRVMADEVFRWIENCKPSGCGQDDFKVCGYNHYCVLREQRREHGELVGEPRTRRGAYNHAAQILKLVDSWELIRAAEREDGQLYDTVLRLRTDLKYHALGPEIETVLGEFSRGQDVEASELQGPSRCLVPWVNMMSQTAGDYAGYCTRKGGEAYLSTFASSVGDGRWLPVRCLREANDAESPECLLYNMLYMAGVEVVPVQGMHGDWFTFSRLCGDVSAVGMNNNRLCPDLSDAYFVRTAKDYGIDILPSEHYGR
ncbi:unnamed protein product [Pedinophyceae sp. YPF-701]|nr:unnamed protein product [Pedinophyceae sp. YPF-701]